MPSLRCSFSLYIIVRRVLEMVLDLAYYFLHSFQLLHVPNDFLLLPITVFIIASE
ncbi:hypothetical protein Tph_c20860 [Thermacetogenium phaeum DSM 12270]|uniref:Uncharacterized protein n=1 Tax=Thermacetogenium phaeum (strain ATCC BAA-254 / DSM 26808 / PB) TaxID=1089553 RepID=K4LK27_THEPS|nr:hypothetical protein Tph_c20860 [Thermacetogenium phaeum DSM 12270]